MVHLPGAVVAQVDTGLEQVLRSPQEQLTQLLLAAAALVVPIPMIGLRQ